MKPPPIVFVDSDVVISSLISKSGAAYLLINETSQELFISDVSYRELQIVAERLGLDKDILDDLVKRRFKTIRQKTTLSQVKEKYGDYVTDINDAHIVAGAVEAKARFLVSYNIKHFKTDKIKSDFKILLTTPARFLQYLRSL